MSKEIYISSTPHETRLAIVENDALTEIYYERENEYTLAGSIYNGKVTRVLPGMQSSFVDIGLERDAFLYITDFMEEAPDSAEFDTAGLGDGGQRAPRLEASAAADGPVIEGQRSEGQRNDGRGERNGRGRRGRGGDRNRGDRGQVADRPAAPEYGAAEGEFAAPRMLPVSEGSVNLGASDADAEGEIGSGAPGADGSRRWRGRRGRRRGRGPVGDRPAVAGEPMQAGETVFPAEDEAESIENAEEFFAEPGYPVVEALESAAASEAGSLDAGPREAAGEGSFNDARRGRTDSGRGDRGGRDGGGRDRGGRDRGGRDNGRGGRGGRDDRGPRAPRGFTPSRGLYGVDSADESLPDAPVGDPIILPGESLSKYREGGADATAPAAASTQAPVAAPEFTLPAGWDGGSVLPGETLSRRAPSEGRSDRSDRSDRSGRPDRSGRRNEPRNEPRTEHRTDARASFVQPVAVDLVPAAVILEEDGPSVAETPEAQPEVALAGHPELVPEAEISHEAVTEQAAAVEPEVATEYEPEEASASYRVDPVARSEYRQSAAVAEAEAELEVESTPEPVPSPTPAPTPAHEEYKAAEQVFGRYAQAEPGSWAAPAAPMSPAAQMPSSAQLEPVTGTPLPGHDVTTLSSSGEMLSEPQTVARTVEPASAPAPIEVPEPASPIRHETAVVMVTELSHEHAEVMEEEEAEAPALHFAPGTGMLEEELLDDDEYEMASVHASYSDENEDVEEEALEGAAGLDPDLGTMLREMSIDQITRTTEPEDDLEEDFLEEDFIGESEELSGGEFEDAEDSEEAEEGSEEYQRTAAATGDFSSEFQEPAVREGGGTDASSYNDRRGGRRDARRGGRDRGSDARRSFESGGRARSTGGSGDRDRGRSGGRGRTSMQSTNLPAISELLKPGQEILVQIAKEPIAKKGARITSHIALPGRFLVFMPTVNHTGVSRKIESDGERRRLKEILLSEKGEASGGFIVRTAAAGASEEELRSDLRFLLNLWADIKNRSEASKSPALIYHDLNLVERILRDQVTDNFSAIWVDTETEYERVLRFLQRFQPSLIRRVKLYGKETPLFEQFGITEEINKALRSKVWLKSGGSIVINQTEALVAIDINTGKFVGKTARLEDTIVKTNLDAIPEIVRQIRLRDLGGIIIIDFIDMDERKNRNKVMAALEEELKSDRAPSKVLQFNDFGLVAITRKRVKQSLERTLSTTCGVCQGTGMTKSPVTVCNDIYIEMRKMYKHLDKGDVMLRVHPEVVKQLKSPGTKWLNEMEEMSGKTILVKSDPSLHPEQFDIH